MVKANISRKWNSSKNPGKQRKYRAKAPLHIKGSFLHSRLSKDLEKTYKRRSLRVRKGDTVKITRGEFKKKTGKVNEVDLKRSKVFIDKVEITKKDGTKRMRPVDPSNIIIIDLNTEDKRRMKKLKTEGGK
jgi:large subunit ribosomal protein L24